MKKVLLFLSGLTLVVSANANTEYSRLSYTMAGIEAGFNWNTMEYSTATSNKSVLGFQFGGTAVINFNHMFGLKTGLYYVQKPFENDTPSGKVSGKLTYAQIPIHFMLKFEEYMGVYLGPSLGMLLSDEASPIALSDKKSMIFPFAIGGQFKFTPMLGVNIFYEVVNGNLASDLTNSRAIGAGLLITFD